MNQIFSSLTGISHKDFYASGVVKGCRLEEKNLISMPCGKLIPKYTDGAVRQKYTSSVSFYKNGAVKRISLEKQTMIHTPIGEYPAESVSFYESGALKRFFPLNGKLSGFWTEEDEEKLCSIFPFHLPAGRFEAKIIGACFYESGSLKSLTLWPNQEVPLITNAGNYPVKIGFSLYESGAIKSLEPARNIDVTTPIGSMLAYDEQAWGIEADNNSLCFDEQGHIIALTTAANTICVHPEDGDHITISPTLIPHPLQDDQFITVPLKISFDKDLVTIDADGVIHKYCLKSTQFVIHS